MQEFKNNNIMKKYILIGLIIIGVVGIGFFIYQNNVSQNTIQLQQKNQSSIQAIQFEEGVMIINPKDKSCNVDNDCVLVPLDCEDCKLGTLNKEVLQKYTEVKNEYCSINKPEIMCDIAFTGELKCINNKCVIDSEPQQSQDQALEQSPYVQKITSINGVWLSINPVQCLTNPWESGWISQDGNDFAKYPRGDILVIESAEKQIITDYYATQGITILNIYSQTFYEKFGESMATCDACSCAQGYILYINVNQSDADKLEGLGFALVKDLPKKQDKYEL